MKAFKLHLVFFVLGILVSGLFLQSTNLVRQTKANISPNKIIQAAQDTAEFGQGQPVSQTLKQDVPFALPYATFSSNTTYPSKLLPQVMDMNGDGLQDLVSSVAFSDNSRATYGMTQYVLLNTGKGFELAYYCKKELQFAAGQPTFYYGDCAG